MSYNMIIPISEGALLRESPADHLDLLTHGNIKDWSRRTFHGQLIVMAES